MCGHTPVFDFDRCRVARAVVVELWVWLTQNWRELAAMSGDAGDAAAWQQLAALASRMQQDTKLVCTPRTHPPTTLTRHRDRVTRDTSMAQPRHRRATLATADTNTTAAATTAHP